MLQKNSALPAGNLTEIHARLLLKVSVIHLLYDHINNSFFSATQEANAVHCYSSEYDPDTELLSITNGRKWRV